MGAASSRSRRAPSSTRSPCSRPMGNSSSGPRTATAKCRARRTSSSLIGWSIHDRSASVQTFTAFTTLHQTSSASSQDGARRGNRLGQRDRLSAPHLDRVALVLRGSIPHPVGEHEIPLTGIHCCRLPAFGTPQRQDVIVFRSVEDSTPDLDIVKRVIGAPGDTLQRVHDPVIPNGQKLEEPYALHTAVTPVPDEDFRLQQIRAWQLPHYIGKDRDRYRPTTHDWGPIVGPPDHCLVRGDNRDES